MEIQTKSSRAAGRSAKTWRWFAREEFGGAMVTLALALPVVLGATGLGVDISLWFMEKRQLQTLADGGAVAGDHAIAVNGDDSLVVSTVNAELARNGFTAGDGREIDVFRPPSKGAYAGDPNFVEVDVSKPRDSLFSAVSFDKTGEIRVRAVSGLAIDGKHCILGLDKEIPGAVEFTGTADADLNCGVASNSASDQSLLVSGSARLLADPAQAHGDIYVQGDAVLQTNHPPRPFAHRVQDPYEGLQVPPTASCDVTGNTIITDTQTLSPGTYCGNISVTNGTATFEPGVYVIYQGDLVTTGTPTLQGNGVTFIFTAPTSDKVGSVQFTGGTVADLSAPTAADGGPYVGILFFQDTIASSFKGGVLVNNTVLGGSDLELNGAMYFPRQEVTYSGGSGATMGCLQIVARKVTFEDNGVIHNDPTACADQGVKELQQVRVQLVE